MRTHLRFLPRHWFLNSHHLVFALITLLRVTKVSNGMHITQRETIFQFSANWSCQQQLVLLTIISWNTFLLPQLTQKPLRPPPTSLFALSLSSFSNSSFLPNLWILGLLKAQLKPYSHLTFKHLLWDFIHPHELNYHHAHALSNVQLLCWALFWNPDPVLQLPNKNF